MPPRSPSSLLRQGAEFLPVAGMLVGVMGVTIVAAWLGEQQFRARADRTMAAEAERLGRVAEGTCNRLIELLYDVRSRLPSPLNLTNTPAAERLFLSVPDKDKPHVGYLGLALWLRHSSLDFIRQDLAARGYTNAHLRPGVRLPFRGGSRVPGWAAPLVTHHAPEGGKITLCDCLEIGIDLLESSFTSAGLPEDAIHGAVVYGRLTYIGTVTMSHANGQPFPLQMAVLPKYAPGSLPAPGTTERLGRMEGLLMLGFQPGPAVRMALLGENEDLGVRFRWVQGENGQFEHAASEESVGPVQRRGALFRTTNTFLASGMPVELELNSSLGWEFRNGRWYSWAIGGTGSLLGGLLTAWMVGQIRLTSRRAEEAAELRAAHAALSAVRETREAVTRELHDNALQNLYVLGLELARGQSQMSHTPQEAARSLDRALEEVRRISADLRRFLSADMCHEESLSPEVVFESIADRFARSSGMTIQMVLKPEVTRSLAPEAVAELAQVLREGLSNAHRHGKAEKVEVSLLPVEAGGWLFRIRDDGCGFPAEGWERNSGFGIPNLRKRAGILGATLDLTTAPGCGVTIELRRAGAPAMDP